MPRYPVTIDGQTIEVEADSPEGAARRAFSQTRAAEMKAPAAAPAPTAPPMRDLTGARREMTPGTGTRYDPTGAGEVAAMREGEAPGTAFALRTLPAMIPLPGVAAGAPLALRGAAALAPGVVGGLSEYAAQKSEQATGARQDIDPASVAISATAPLAVGAALRVSRGLERTATRILPSRFRAAHKEALAASKVAGEELAPGVSASQLFDAARKSGAETVPATVTTKILASLDDSIPAEPANAGLKTLRAHMVNVQKAIGGLEPAPAGVGTSLPQLNVKELMKLRRDIGADLTKAKEMGALYKGIMTDLELAAEAGGPSASMAKEALTAFKRDLGVSKFHELVEAATQHKAIFGADVPALNVAKLAKSFSQNRDELTSLVGPEGMQVLGAFIQRFRSLPPDVAYNGWGRLIGAVFGAGGVATGQLPTAVATAGGLELLVNAALVGKNPQAVQQLMTTLVQAARAGAVTQAE